MTTFSWLHLSDFHFGLTQQKVLWPNLRQPFWDDLEQLHQKTGPWQAVLFTGDLVQKGIADEFQSMQRELLDVLMDKLRTWGSTDAVLLAVPGNHDLCRPDADSEDPAIHTLLEEDGFARIADKFWDEQKGKAYRRVVNDAFAPYTAWWTQHAPQAIRPGLLPGDFAYTLNCGARRIGIVGLNTAFLQLQGGDYHGRLIWDARQLHAVCDGAVDHWLQQHDLCLLLTHQGPDWLTPAAREHGETEIAPAGRFALHLYGHMHQATLHYQSVGGSSKKICRLQASSAFGMELYGEPPTLSRNHGYSVGQICFTSSQAEFKLYPRLATDKPRGNGWRYIADAENVELSEDGSTAAEILCKFKTPHSTPTQPAPPPAPTLHTDLSRIDRYAPPKLLGREAEMALLNDAWQQALKHTLPRPRMVAFIALGGEGKTSLVAKWVIELMAREACDTAFAWSFYSQGTREQSAASSDLFINDALKFFGDHDTAASALGADEKARRLAALLSTRRALLILDGVEPLQYAPTTPLAGELKDNGLKTLLKLLAVNNAGLCVLTSRYTLTDLQAYPVLEHKLLRLSTEAGVALLRQLAVRGTQAEYEQLVNDVKGHALTLNLLARYLVEAHAGDIRQRYQVKLGVANQALGGHAFRVMDAYVTWFNRANASKKERNMGKQALALLQLLGLFDRPTTADCFKALLSAPSIPKLNHKLVELSKTELNTLLKRLADSQLVTASRNPAGQLLSLDTHPLIREYFAQRLKTQHPKAWRAGHERIYWHLCDTTHEDEQPSLEDLQPLYQAVWHGCLAGKQQEVCVEVYYKRIVRQEESYSIHKLGAFGADLGAVACFFDMPWVRVNHGLSEQAQAWLLNEAAYRLRALGRLNEALQPMAAGLKMRVAQKNWENAAKSACNLSELTLTLGQLQGETGALHYAECSVVYADKSGDAFERMSDRTTHADALQQAGEQAAALALFQQAEQLQAERQPHYPLLYSVHGFFYCELLLQRAECAAWLSLLVHQPTEAEAALHCDSVAQRAAQTIELSKRENWLLTIALDHLTLGRCQLYQALLKPDNPSSAALTTLNTAVDGLRRAGYQDYLPRGLLTRAWALALNPDTHADAIADLNEAWEIAERGPMPLHQADIHLHRARLFGKQTAYPWISVAHDLAEARRLIEKHGYGRRLQELADAEAAFGV